MSVARGVRDCAEDGEGRRGEEGLDCGGRGGHGGRWLFVAGERGGARGGRIDIAPVTCRSGTDCHSAGFCALWAAAPDCCCLSPGASCADEPPSCPTPGSIIIGATSGGHPIAALAAVSLDPTLSPPPLSRPHNGHFCVRRPLSAPAVSANTYAGKKTSPTTRTPPTARPTRRRCTPSISSRTTAARARCSSTSAAGRAS